MPTVNRFADFHDEIAEWRRDLHANPEILFEVHRTAGVVEEKLKEFGVDEVIPGIAKNWGCGGHPRQHQQQRQGHRSARRYGCIADPGNSRSAA